MNPSFEEADNATLAISGVNEWRQPTLKESVYLSTETCFHHPVLCRGFKSAKSGNACVGLLLFARTGNTIGGWSYIQGKLKRPLEKGKIYQVEFYLSHADSSPIVVNQIGVLLSKTVKKYKIKARYPGKHQVTYSSQKYLKGKSNWMKFSETYMASGGEKYVTIGNFSAIKDTPYQIVDKDFWKRNNIINPNLLSAKYTLEAFYFIDDDSIVETDLTGEEGFYESIYFETNQYKISNVHLEKLDQLVSLKITNFTVIIDGYADS